MNEILLTGVEIIFSIWSVIFSNVFWSGIEFLWSEDTMYFLKPINGFENGLSGLIKSFFIDEIKLILDEMN